MCYNEGTKIVVLAGAWNTPLTLLAHLLLKGRCTMSSIPHYVYEWVDPRDQSVFYVGITINLYARYRQHMHCDGLNPQKDARIQEILASGHLPVMRTIEQVKSFDGALERESYWIKFYLQQGIALTNIARTPTVSKGTSSKPAKRGQQFRIDDLERVTFWLNGTEFNAATVDAETFCEKAAMHANFSDDIGWDSLRQRSYFLSKLWDYCEEDNFQFPYDVVPEKGE